MRVVVWRRAACSAHSPVGGSELSEGHPSIITDNSASAEETILKLIEPDPPSNDRKLESLRHGCHAEGLKLCR
jgi:hypothetical protein